LEVSVLTLEAAVQRSSYFVVPPFLYPRQVGDFFKGIEEADHKNYISEVFAFVTITLCYSRK
jgi:abscisic-aldehyde oxidase